VDVAIRNIRFRQQNRIGWRVQGQFEVGNLVTQHAQRAIQEAVRWKRLGAKIIVVLTNTDFADDNLGRRLPNCGADGFEERCSLRLARGEAYRQDLLAKSLVTWHTKISFQIPVRRL
jgi:hypothetical protein